MPKLITVDELKEKLNHYDGKLGVVVFKDSKGDDAPITAENWEIQDSCFFPNDDVEFDGPVLRISII